MITCAVSGGILMLKAAVLISCIWTVGAATQCSTGIITNLFDKRWLA